MTARAARRGLKSGEGDRLLVDSRLDESEWVVLEAGTHEQSPRFRTADLVSFSGARLVDLIQD